ncbi:DNA polymerase alpha, subunit B [Epithele typhae]|uniref:DNA polymerase alpha, subunit B n=1 Tax=Epithele typhae TaxID=378194 RepID=UPI002008AD81|nr:DNA polymerase alpha, subunit B [Epithele typhae]KAH9933127.1 DNA polymerase alpha, subunit B [Epithele typhae]
MDSATLRSQVTERFGDSIEDSLVDDCVKLCQNHNMSGEDLFYKWEAVSFNRGPRQFSVQDLDDVRKTIQRDLAKRAGVNKMLSSRGKLSGLQSRNFGGPPTAAARGGRPPFGTPGPIGTPVKGKMPIPVARVQDGFDVARIEEKRMPVAGPSRVNFVGPAMDEKSRKRRSYHYMYEKPLGRSEVLDDRIDYFGEQVKEYYNIAELGDPSAVTDEDVVVVGRIAQDSESGSGKLTESSLLLQSSRYMGSGARVPLRFDSDLKVRKGKKGLAGQGLFPGAIVALKGKYGGGGSFLASEILSLPPLEPAPPSLVKTESGETQFSMCVACGPFTAESDLEFRPLQHLVTSLRATKPAVVLLLGPFIDSTHSMIKAGDVDSTPEDMFRTVLVARLREFLDDSPGSIALLVPGVRDILSDHAVFPQPELNSALADDPRIRMLPNPARFTLNGVHIAASSVDTLFHLRTEELFKRAGEVEPLDAPEVPLGQPPTDAMANLCRHILQQRSFYPLFPVPLAAAHEVSLDATHAELLSLAPEPDDEDADAEPCPVDGGGDPSMARCAPDVLVLPCRLKHFSKIVDDTIAINPSYLSKWMYAMVEYAGYTAPGPARDRIKVEINRLEGATGSQS